MKRMYEEPKMLTVLLEDLDIVTVSPGGNEPTEGDGSGEGSYDDIFGE